MTNSNKIQKISLEFNAEIKKFLDNSVSNLSNEIYIGKLENIVNEIQSKRDKFSILAEKYSTPFYVYDYQNLQVSIKEYLAAFSKYIPNCTHYYAVKLNHYHELLKDIFQAGFSADVSSARELFLAKHAGATKFLFSGPAKTKKELTQALEAGVDLVINVDSFSELKKLKEVCKELSINECRIGVRVTFDKHGSWTKFGIPLNKLNDFCKELENQSVIKLIGIQFHMSWNKDGKIFYEVIEELGNYLKNHLPAKNLEQIEFIDIGGGFRPYQSEGYYPEDTPIGQIQNNLAEILDIEIKNPHPYYILESVPIDEYAKDIGEAINKYLRPIKDFQYITEPGRIIVNSALHVLLSIVDVKSDNCVITDGGTNIIGFERFEFDYFPLINISSPSMEEKEISVFGSLCMPQDYWGLRIFTDTINEGDLIVVPYQGALTYANMNDFIKGRVEVYKLKE